MELATDTRLVAQYSPTSTPILDALRPVPQESSSKLSSGEYFFFSSLVILALINLPNIQAAAGEIALAPLAFAVVLLAIPACAVMVSAGVHELGHLIAAQLAGFRLVKLSLQGAPDCGHEGESLHACQGMPLGILILQPGRADNLARRLRTVAAGGPVANLLLPLALEAYANWSGANSLEAYAVHVVALLSALWGVAALMPDVGRRGNFSDGARLLMLARRDERAARWLAILELQSALGRGEHPRQWDKGKMAAATAVSDGSRDAVAADWLAYLWASQRQDITSATRYLEDALAAPRASSAWLRDHLFVEAAVFQAWFRDNPAKAQAWVAQIRGRRLTPLEQQRVHAALLWAEGRLFDAWEKLAECFLLLNQIPESPARELADKAMQEWKHQMESRMLTRAWRTMYSLSQQVEEPAHHAEMFRS